MRWDIELRPDQRGNPIVASANVDLSGVSLPTYDDIIKIFDNPAKQHSLKTWGRPKDDHATVDVPHWIGVCNSTPLHTDPLYPRYTHQLAVAADPGMVLRGVDKVETPVTVGTLFILDTHSPHQAFTTNPEGHWYIAASIDLHEPMPMDEITDMLVGWASRTSLFCAGRRSGRWPQEAIDEFNRQAA